MTNLKDKKIISLTNSSDWKHPIRSKASNTSGNQTETRDQYRARTHISLSYCISSLIHQSQNSRSGFYLCQNVRVFNSSIPTIQIPISQYRIPHSSWLDYFFVSLSLPILHDQNKENVMTSYSKWNDNWKGLYWLNIKIWHSRMHKFDLPSQNSWQGIRSNSHEHGFASSLVH